MYHNWQMNTLKSIEVNVADVCDSSSKSCVSTIQGSTFRWFHLSTFNHNWFRICINTLLTRKTRHYFKKVGAHNLLMMRQSSANRMEILVKVTCVNVTYFWTVYVDVDSTSMACFMQERSSYHQVVLSESPKKNSCSYRNCWGNWPVQNIWKAFFT